MKPLLTSLPTDKRLGLSPPGRYPHRSRAFHAMLLAMLYNTSRHIVERDAADLYPNVPLNHILPVFAPMAVRKHRTELKLLVRQDEPAIFSGEQREEWWERHEDVKLMQRWLMPRMSQLVEGYRNANGMGSVRLVEGMFYLGSRCLIYLTVRLDLSELGVYEPGYCVARFGDTQPSLGIGS